MESDESERSLCVEPAAPRMTSNIHVKHEIHQLFARPVHFRDQILLVPKMHRDAFLLVNPRDDFLSHYSLLWLVKFQQRYQVGHSTSK
jgi:hypothetical protein